MPILFAFIFLCTVVTQAAALDGSQSTAGTNVRGDVLYWEGDELIVKEMSGREVRVRVTPETKIDGAAGRLKTGDKIDAQVNSDGRAVAISLQVPGDGSGGVTPGSR